jgi:hypothetical protein
MHTAEQLTREMFEVELAGRRARREELLDWGERDRLGIVVNAPYGGLGAGLLLSLAITAFYDVPGKQRRSRYLYPDHYLLHVGGPWGSHGYFDFWPDYKELFLANSKAQVLAAINSHGITHLVVPAGTGDASRHRQGEEDVACDRIKQAFVYSPDGCVPDADIVIRAHHANVLANFDFTLRPDRALEDAEYYCARLDPEAPEAQDTRFAIELLRARALEVPESHPVRQKALLRLASARNSGGLREELCRSEVRSALNLVAW